MLYNIFMLIVAFYGVICSRQLAEFIVKRGENIFISKYISRKFNILMNQLIILFVSIFFIIMNTAELLSSISKR